MESDFLKFIAGILGVDEKSISMETGRGGIPEWDSLMQLRLVAEICDEYDVDIPIDEVANIKTLADFYGYIGERK